MTIQTPNTHTLQFHSVCIAITFHRIDLLYKYDWVFGVGNVGVRCVGRFAFLLFLVQNGDPAKGRVAGKWLSVTRRQCTKYKNTSD